MLESLKKSEIILTMYNIRKTKSRDASMKSSSNSSMNVGSKKPKDYNINVNEYLIMEHDSEYQCSQLNLKKTYWERKAVIIWWIIFWISINQQ